jgi:hypothetical protein
VTVEVDTGKSSKTLRSEEHKKPLSTFFGRQVCGRICSLKEEKSRSIVGNISSLH